MYRVAELDFNQVCGPDPFKAFAAIRKGWGPTRTRTVGAPVRKAATGPLSDRRAQTDHLGLERAVARMGTRIVKLLSIIVSMRA